MKKLALILAVVMLLSLSAVLLTACDSNDNSNDDPLVNGGHDNNDDNGTGNGGTTGGMNIPDDADEDFVLELLEALTVNVDFPFREFQQLTEDNFYSTVSLEYIPGVVGSIDMGIHRVQPYVVVLLLMPEGSDIQGTADQIRENADTNRWICVFADEARVWVEGRFIIFAMSDTERLDAVEAEIPAVLRG